MAKAIFHVSERAISLSVTPIVGERMRREFACAQKLQQDGADAEKESDYRVAKSLARSGLLRSRRGRTETYFRV